MFQFRQFSPVSQFLFSLVRITENKKPALAKTLKIRDNSASILTKEEKSAMVSNTRVFSIDTKQNETTERQTPLTAVGELQNPWKFFSRIENCC